MEDIFCYTSPQTASSGSGPLRGLKTAIQPCFCVADWPTDAGSRALADFTALEDATVVERLRQAGAEVVLTRETDHDLAGITGNYSYRSKIEDLTRRVAIANEKQADLFISIHVNSFPDPREKGAQTFSQPGSAAGKQLAKAIQQELNNHLQNSGRQDKQVDYFTNRMAKMPSTIVEIGFISNPGEESLMLNPQYQQKIAWSIYAGIARYLAEPKAAMSPYIR